MEIKEESLDSEISKKIIEIITDSIAEEFGEPESCSSNLTYDNNTPHHHIISYDHPDHYTISIQIIMLLETSQALIVVYNSGVSYDKKPVNINDPNMIKDTIAFLSKFLENKNNG